MTLINPGELSAIHDAERLRRLSRPQMAAIAKCGGDIARPSFLNAGSAPREAKEVGPMQPVIRICKDIEDGDRFYTLGNELVDFLQVIRNWAFREPAKHGLSIDEAYRSIGRECIICHDRHLFKPRPHLTHKSGAFDGQSDLFTIGGNRLVIFLPRNQLFAVVRKLLTALNA